MDANAIQLQYDIPVFIFYFLFLFRYPSNFMGNGPLERAKYNSILLPERPTMQPYFNTVVAKPIAYYHTRADIMWFPEIHRTLAPKQFKDQCYNAIYNII